MRFREWFRPPRHILTVFLGAAVVSGAALGWLGWLLLEQDKAVEMQRRQERLDVAADRAVAVMQRSVGDLEARLGERTMSATPPKGVSVIDAGKDGIAATPGLLYFPEAMRLPEAAAATFLEAERLEFAGNDAAGAARIWRQMEDRLHAIVAGSQYLKALTGETLPGDLSRALASFVRSILFGDSPFDRFINGGRTALSAEQQEGLQLFRGKANCTPVT